MTEHTSANMPDFSDTDASGVAHRIVGTTMPVLEVQLQPGQSVISLGGEMTWLTASVSLGTQASGLGTSGLGGMFKRVLAGSTIFMTEYTATGTTGTVAFATKMPAHIKAISVNASQQYMVSRHGFLAGTSGITVDVGFQQKLGAGIFSGNGFLMQRVAGEGTAWVELSGEMIEYDLAPGEVLRVHPGHVGLFEAHMALEIEMVKGIKNMLFGADALFLAKLTGPGKVYLQTLTLPGLAHAIMPYLPENNK